MPTTRRNLVGLGLAALASLALTVWLAWRPAAPTPGVLEANGRIEGDQAAVGAKVGGKIVRLAVREGERLAAGTLIAELASDQVQAQLQTFVVTLAALGLALWVPWWFAVPIRGSLLLFFALSALFLWSGLGLGLFLGTLAANLQQALLLGFFTLFPILVISGVVVPIDSMPWPIQLLSLLSPLRYYLEAGLGVFLKGVGIDVLWPQALAMSGLGGVVLALGLWRFGRRIR